VRVSNTYDNADHLLLLANLTSTGTTLSSFNYAYNGVGNRTRVLEVDGSVVTWNYDPTYQLTNEQRSGANSYNITYTYDAVGNRTLMVSTGAPTTYTYNAANELATSQAAAGVTTYGFDGNGNLLTSAAPGNQLTTNTWDGENRLTQVALPAAITDIFTYDGDGRRIQKQDSTGTSKYIWDRFNVVSETDASNNTTVVYTLRPYVYGTLISQARSGATSYYHYDDLGSTDSLSDSTGNILNSYKYYAFGSILLRIENVTNDFTYVGREGYYFDTDLAGFLLRARYYSPALARFISRDPLSFKDAADVYAFVSNSPLNYTDPSGLLKVACRCRCIAVGQPGAFGQTYEITVPNQAAASNSCETKCRSLSVVPLTQCFSVAISAPFSLAPAAGLSFPNVPLGDLYYGFLSPLCCPFPTCKTKLLAQYPVKPNPGTVKFSGQVPGGTHKVYAFPGVGSYVGGGGADPSIQVIVACPGQGAVVYHFGTNNGNAGASIEKYAWLENCHALICGGDNSVPSNCLMNDIVAAMRAIGLKLDGILNSTGCVLGGDDKWYYGSSYTQSVDRNPGCKNWIE